MLGSIEQQLASLPSLGRAELGKLWQQFFKTAPNPGMRKGLMFRFLAHRMQEQAFGPLPPRSQQRIRQLASAFAANPNVEVSAGPRMRAGTRLVRQWRDQVHVVNVEERTFEYQGARYESLSKIARLITGTRWSGPLFFGLKHSKQNTEAIGDRA
jgi:hypothetical protein